MGKTILIPTDFKVESLNTLKTALSHSEEKDIEIILMHSALMPDSITDLLFYSPDKVIASHMTPEFKKALEVLKNRFESNISDIGLVVLTGHTMDMMEKFLKAYKIDEIYIPKHYKLKETKSSFNPIPLLVKSDVPVHQMEWGVNSSSDKDHLDVLFK